LRDLKLKNIPASIRQKLLNLARERNEDFGLILTKYGLERILFRLSKSKYREIFILKGALLFELWTKERYRPTRDADFMARGDNSPERFVQIFRDISAIEIEDDGLRFDPKMVKAQRIKEDAEYEGVRVIFTAFLEKAQIPIQIDIGFGDMITPGPVEMEYPTLLVPPSPRLLAYPRETVVSEKLEAVVKLGIANTRMKDFHDLYTLSTVFQFDGKTLVEAVRATFKQRGTDLPIGGVPLAFTREFYADEIKVKQWNAFCYKNKPYVPQTELRDIIARLALFLIPVIMSAQQERALCSTWTSAHAWRSTSDQ
jgi:nucleotidyltransferase AbiEii toxin of type IV toxin-antitoxin system